MKGRIISTQTNFQVQYEEDGVRKYLNLVEETNIKPLYIGREVEFEIVAIPNTNATYTSENGWSENPIKELRAEVVGFGYNPSLYSDIESAIIFWANDGTRTAGSLTREIMSMLDGDSVEEVEEEYLKDEYPVFGGPFTDALSPWQWLKKYYNLIRK